LVLFGHRLLFIYFCKELFQAMVKNSVHIKNIGELLSLPYLANDIRTRINSLVLDCNLVERQLSAPVFLNAATIILVLSGTAQLNINYRSYFIQANTAVLLSASHLFHFRDCSPDFSGLCLLVSKEFMDEMDSTDMIYRRIRYGVKLYNTPMVGLNEEDSILIRDRMLAVGKVIGQPGHLYYKEVILNSLFAFYLDFSNIIDRKEEFKGEGNLNRYESVIKAFIELLVRHYRKEHKVEFYATKLNLSAHYLTLIVKRITGQSVCDFIFEMLFSEARNLLKHSPLSIQEITAELHFSDQSAFGKFFKRKSGFSPIDYRKKQS
jgi:AraC family transcriptional regulator, transcriptional activator of pobA